MHSEKLQEKSTLPQVQAKMGTIKEVLSPVIIAVIRPAFSSGKITS